MAKKLFLTDKMGVSMSISLKIPDNLLKFPRFLPNDIEDFISYYPNKYPGIIKKYEEVAEKYAMDPEGFSEYADSQKKELCDGFKKIETEYKNGNQSNLKFLVETDLRLNKLFCYRFWIVNYLFADGPIHEFYIDMMKHMIRKFVDVSGEAEEFEQKVLLVQRDLLQSDFADLYLQQALSGVKIIRLLENIPEFKEIYSEVLKLITDDVKENQKEINILWEELYPMIEHIKDTKNRESLIGELSIPLNLAKRYNKMLPLTNALTHAVEFRNENIELEKRYIGMTADIDRIFLQAKKVLSKEEYEVFEISYKQSRNFARYKDIIGAIDTELLPMWFDIHSKVIDILVKESPNLKIRSGGQGLLFYRLIWFLPAELKVSVMTPDLTPFDVKKT